MPRHLEKGQVIKSTGSWYDILDEVGKVHKGRLRGKMKLDGLKVTNPVAVGDHVSMEDEQDGTVKITGVLDRRNYLIRKSTHKTAHAQILASNLDLAVIVASLAMPKTSTGFIDRFLVAAEWQSIPTLLVFNKLDQLNELGMQYLAELQRTYQEIGYHTLAVSALTGEGIEALEDRLAHKLTLIAGHSGVGKSTLINQLIPDAGQRTAEVSNYAKKGVHTTTFAEVFNAGKGIRLIDTPGIKELGIMEVPAEELDHCFPEMRQMALQCKFHNCMHIQEPGCRIMELVEQEEIAHSRYQSYLSIMLSDDNRR